MLIFTQICGIIGTFFTVLAFFNNERNKILIYKCISDGIFSVQWFILGGYSGCIISLIAVIRNFVYFILSKKNLNTLPYFLGFTTVIIVFGFLGYKSPIDLLAIIGSVTYSLSFSIKDVMKLKYLTLIASILWLFYGVAYRSIGGILSESFSILSTVISLIILEKTTDFRVQKAKRLK